MQLDEVIKSSFSYEPATGKLFRDGKEINNRPDSSTGYLKISIKNKRMSAHRVAWFLHYGEWPEDCIDHINHKKLDNRIENLRAVSRADNNRNVPMLSNNKSGVKGVSYCSKTLRWGVCIHIPYSGGKRARKYVKTKDLAVELAELVYSELGYHPNHYKVLN